MSALPHLGGKEYLCGVESKAYLETIIGKDPVQVSSSVRFAMRCPVLT